MPSSTTTDSNETGGTPTSIISGSSPIISPPLSVPPYNHSSDSSNEGADKKNNYKDAPKVINLNRLKEFENYFLYCSRLNQLQCVHPVQQ